MQSLLRRVVAGPRNPHDEANLDLCYVTESLIATSGPSSTYPSRAYRNPLDSLVKFLDEKHGEDWAIWEFRAEGTGYPDSEVYNRIWHFPWPDHHPPPFRLIPSMMASMRNWLHPEGVEKSRRVVVVHCKAGKGRSGTSVVSYLMSEEGWLKEDALQRFTERRMRPGFGAGVSIPSQLRYVDYVERWIKGGKTYVEQTVEVLEVHTWGLRDGVKIAVEGYLDEGKKIKTFHVFMKGERDDVDEHGVRKPKLANSRSSSPGNINASNVESAEEARTNTIFKPYHPILIPTNDINLAIERRSRAGYGLTMVTAVAHVWFNTFFEGNGPENHAKAAQTNPYFTTPPTDQPQTQYPQASTPSVPRPDTSGVFEIPWDAMDGIKGSSRKGTRAFDKCAVVWRVVSSYQDFALPSSSSSTSLSNHARDNSILITEPAPNENVTDTASADWRGRRGKNNLDEAATKHGAHMNTGLGLHPQSAWGGKASRDSSAGSFGKGESVLVGREARKAEDEADSDEDGVLGINRGVVGVSGGEEGGTGNVPGGELRGRREEMLGTVKRDKKGDISSS